MLKYKTEIKEDKREQVIKEFLPYIKYTAYRLSWKLPQHVTIDDLISVGLMGLMDALNRFEPGKVKLKTYAELRIKGAMIDELRATAWIPRSMRKKIEVINKARMKLEKRYGRMPDDAEVAKSLKMPLDEYFKTLQYATSSNPVRLEDFRNNKYADSDLNISECIADPSAKTPLALLEEKDTAERLAGLIDTLPKKEKTVLALYYYEELTMQEIGRVLSITESRVCQIHSQALLKLKTKIAQLG
ncbi:MAG: FliA/WhiG family RNA polymerase sigma factor [Nitrospiraceae bacterium]|nr:MAG: FliA/WhiG family RNA polymerase sigma factor [Nitrospiraceae bacterium]